MSRLRVGVACVAGAALASLAACSSGNDGAPTDPPGTRASPTGPDLSRAAAPSFSGTRRGLPETIDNSPHLYRLVRLTGCAEIPGGRRASGTARNPSSHEMAYLVLVVFTDPQARVLDWATAKVTAAPGRTVPWTVTTSVKAPAGIGCAVRGVS